ncbi:MAG TPA: hypothetical protein VM030_04025 [Acidimicrobiales bacterium]|nr:hypothetical protein [Acidimicrobiales bacterium]
MKRFVVRVWIPDRPGALGAVASRIGAVRGDLVGIDILERGGGRAIDELVVELADGDLVPLLLAEMGQVDGVDVEEIHEVGEWSHDPRLDALETASVLVSQSTGEGLLTALVEHAARDFEAEWATAIDPAVPRALATVGNPPTESWLAAFVAGTRSSERMTAQECGPDDVACALFDGAGLALVLGRKGRPFRARERRQLAALARIADARLAQLT